MVELSVKTIESILSDLRDIIDTVKNLPERFEIRPSQNKQFYFVIIAPNNEPIGTSEMYTTKDACKDGIQAVKKWVPTAPVVDTTL
jgi:uncharacterized protein YegP (UPF0339 family)